MGKRRRFRNRGKVKQRASESELVSLFLTLECYSFALGKGIAWPRKGLRSKAKKTFLTFGKRAAESAKAVDVHQWLAHKHRFRMRGSTEASTLDDGAEAA